MSNGPNGYLLANTTHICDVWIHFHRHPVEQERYHSATLGVDPLSEAEAATINTANDDDTLELSFITPDGVPIVIIAGELELIRPAAKEHTQVLIQAIENDAWRWFLWTEADNHQRPAPTNPA